MNISIIWDNIIRKKMKVIINGQDKILEDNLSLKEIIQNLNIEDKEKCRLLFTNKKIRCSILY